MTDAKKAPRKRGNDSPLTRKRIACGLTQAQLAEEIGCRQKDISRWEHGTRTPSAITLSKIAKALDCSMEDLL